MKMLLILTNPVEMKGFLIETCCCFQVAVIVSMRGTAMLEKMLPFS